MENALGPRTAILQALISGPGFGLDLIERVKKHTNGRVKLGQGTVYPLLRELEAEGLLDSYEGEPMPERGGRPRRYYKLNAAGQKAAMEERTDLGGLLGLLPEGA